MACSRCSPAPGQPLPELLLSVGSSRWRASLARGRCYGFAAPPGVAADSLRQRLLEGQAGDGGLQWQPPLATGIALLTPAITLLSNLQLWENILLPQTYHASHLPVDIEHNLRRWLAVLRPGNEAGAWLHRPVGRASEQDRLAALLLRALVAPAAVVVLTEEWVQLIPPAQRGRWLQLLQEETEAQRRSLLYLAATTQESGDPPGYPPLPWKKAPIEANGNDVAAA